MVALALFARRQLRLTTPLIDVRLFADKAFSGVVVANLLSVLGLSGVVFFLSQFFQLVGGYSPMQAGLAELPAAVAAMVFGLLAGVFCASGRAASSWRAGWHLSVQGWRR